MFGRIARGYDVANVILSGGFDRWWRRRLVAAVRRQSPGCVLDVATGSGDVAFALARALGPTVPVLGLDFCPPMLAQAEAKQRAAPGGRYAHVTFAPGDGLNLPLGNASQDAATISFGLRNLADRARGLAELRRVLRPGGRLRPRPRPHHPAPPEDHHPPLEALLRRLPPGSGGHLPARRGGLLPALPRRARERRAPLDRLHLRGRRRPPL